MYLEYIECTCTEVGMCTRMSVRRNKKVMLPPTGRIKMVTFSLKRLMLVIESAAIRSNVSV